MQGDLRTPAIVSFLEQKIGFRAGKGQKSKPILKLHKDATADMVSNLTKSQPGDSPRLHLFYSGDSLDTAVVSGDGTKVMMPNCDSVECALLVLVATYYVFDIDYPRAYSMVLGFIQQSVLCQPFTTTTTKGFTSMIHMLQ